MSGNEKNVQIATVTNTDNGQSAPEVRQDVVAVEEPMEIRVVAGPVDQRKGKSLSITMRTPGNDPDLAVGFLFAEGIIQSQSQIENIEPVSYTHLTLPTICSV